MVYRPGVGGHVQDPLVLVEVMSEHTVLRDRLAKYAAYTAIPGLQAYLIAEQQERRMYAYARTGGSWTLSDLEGTASMDLPCLDMRLSFDEIYGGVHG